MSWKYPAKIFVRRSIFHSKNIYRSIIIEVNLEVLRSTHKDDGVSFLLLSLCASRKTYRQTVSVSAINLLRQKCKKRTLTETLHSGKRDSYNMDGSRGGTGGLDHVLS